MGILLSAFSIQNSEFDFGLLAWVTGSLGEAVAARKPGLDSRPVAFPPCRSLACYRGRSRWGGSHGQPVRDQIQNSEFRIQHSELIFPEPPGPGLGAGRLFVVFLLLDMVVAFGERSSVSLIGASRGAGRARSPLRARWNPWKLVRIVVATGAEDPHPGPLPEYRERG